MYRILPQSFFHWAVSTALARYIAKSVFAFPIFETFHIFGLLLLLGPVFVVDTAVLGFGLSDDPGKLARKVMPCALIGLALALCTGIPMFMSSAEGYSSNTPLMFKMMFLVSAIVLQTLIHKIPHMYDHSTVGKVAATLSLICWFGVAYGGRAIAFPNMFYGG